ncbi:hypothetical protein FRC11_001624, partial [Ceratobasidium sp. 423]
PWMPNTPIPTMDELEACPHCGVMLGACQIHRHLAVYTVDLDSDSLPALEDVYHPMSPNPPNPPDPPVGGVGILVNEEMGEVGDNPVEVATQDLENMTLGAEDPIIAPVPLRRNPRVTIEEWPDPDDDFARSEASEDSLPPEPEFIECRDTPLGYHPEDEAVLDDEEL